MKGSDARVLAGEIVAGMEKKYGNAPYEDRGKQVDTIVASAEEWEEYIASSIFAFFHGGILPGFKREDIGGA